MHLNMIVYLKWVIVINFFISASGEEDHLADLLHQLIHIYSSDQATHDSLPQRILYPMECEKSILQNLNDIPEFSLVPGTIRDFYNIMNTVYFHKASGSRIKYEINGICKEAEHFWENAAYLIAECSISIQKHCVMQLGGYVVALPGTKLLTYYERPPSLYYAKGVPGRSRCRRRHHGGKSQSLSKCICLHKKNDEYLLRSPNISLSVTDLYNIQKEFYFHECPCHMLEITRKNGKTNSPIPGYSETHSMNHCDEICKSNHYSTNHTRNHGLSSNASNTMKSNNFPSRPSSLPKDPPITATSRTPVSSPHCVTNTEREEESKKPSTEHDNYTPSSNPPLVSESTTKNTEWKRHSKCGKSSMKEVTPGFGNLMARDNTAKPGEFPWHAAIYMKTKQENDLICAATIISRRALITAAHCFFGENSSKNTSDFLVAVGKFNFQRNQTDSSITKFHDITQIIMHPSYVHPETENDLAIIITQETITFNDIVLDICLPSSDENITLEKSLLDTVGWNADGSGMISNNVLRTTKYPYISNQDCKATLTDDSRQYLTQERFCTLKWIDPTVDRGDIGGGLALKHHDTYYLVGVINVFSEYPPNIVFCTDLRIFYTWIHDEISKIP